MVQNLGKELIKEATVLKAQDIYLIPATNDHYKISMRIGDQRQPFATLDTQQVESLISHFKFVAGMNIGEKRRCQLGSCDYQIGQDQPMSLRLSTVGDYRGKESMVIRLLYSQKRTLKFWFDRDEIVASQVQGRGLYLFSGPVGSGKTSLMYQLITQVSASSQVLTIEDPVEIKDEKLLQLQVNTSIGLSYDNLIKLSLRHRPDLLIIGEIRDSETAKAVIRASLTGALVFSTIHAKSISGVYARLMELGVKREELNNCLQFIAYQRLIGGGALIDFAKKDFEKHDPDQWNREIDLLLEEGHISWQEAQMEKIIP
ncbi:competence type IV pilus ATPase ComGA [Streptococcus catagoni]|uniref:competence type IV pilus ATPase ComGA n=1 Tax=Streptococcus catagoni TaxID=2654874 RepID=UPI00140B0253|nr:competence type IV pilus ATPase ComGA [Streptococcus catagoni]